MALHPWQSPTCVSLALLPTGHQCESSESSQLLSGVDCVATSISPPHAVVEAAFTFLPTARNAMVRSRMRNLLLFSSWKQPHNHNVNRQVKGCKHRNVTWRIGHVAGRLGNGHCRWQRRTGGGWATYLG